MGTGKVILLGRNTCQMFCRHGPPEPPAWLPGTVDERRRMTSSPRRTTWRNSGLAGPASSDMPALWPEERGAMRDRRPGSPEHLGQLGSSVNACYRHCHRCRLACLLDLL